MLFVVWHMVSFLLGTTALLARVPRDAHPNPALRFFAAAQLAFAAGIFIVRGQRTLGAGFALPQWILLGPLALAIAFPNEAAAATMVLLALLHVAWAFGVTFPSPSRALAPTYVIGWREGSPHAEPWP